MNRITVSAPGKLMLLGEHAVVYNHPCLVTAVDQRMRATVEVLNENIFELDAPDVKITDYKKSIDQVGSGDIPKGAKFVEVAVKNFADKYPLFTSIKGGLKISTVSEFSSQFGFGSSSASTVCVVKALSEISQSNLSDEEIFKIAYKTVLDIQGKGSGFDVAAAVYGGVLYFVTGGAKIEKLDIKNLPLVVGYSGVKANTVTLMNQVKEKFADNADRLAEIYSLIDRLVESAKKEFLAGAWDRAGQLMNENQKLLVELGVSIRKLDDMISAATGAGAYGAKLSGAGGGDCMIAFSSDEKRADVEDAIRDAGGEVIKVAPNAEGVRIEK